jgi:hypothetical protein
MSDGDTPTSPTVNGVRGPSQTSAATAAATAARRRSKDEKLLREITGRLDALDGDHLAALTVLAVEEVERRAAARQQEAGTE